jgi:hypothetical protein
MAAQIFLEQGDVSIGISLIFFSQSLGGAVLICISQSLFTNYLTSTFQNISSIHPKAIVAARATQLAKVFPLEKLAEVLVVYTIPLVRALLDVAAVSCLMVLPALGMEWRTVKKQKPAVSGSRKYQDNFCGKSLLCAHGIWLILYAGHLVSTASDALEMWNKDRELCDSDSSGLYLSISKFGCNLPAIVLFLFPRNQVLLGELISV